MNSLNKIVISFFVVRLEVDIPPNHHQMHLSMPFID